MPQGDPGPLLTLPPPALHVVGLEEQGVACGVPPLRLRVGVHHEGQEHVQYHQDHQDLEGPEPLTRHDAPRPPQAFMSNSFIIMAKQD